MADKRALLAQLLQRKQADAPSHLFARFRACAARYPELRALGDLTYRQLHQRVLALAGYLQASGVKAQDTLGVCRDDSPEMVIALLAGWALGATLLPLPDAEANAMSCLRPQADKLLGPPSFAAQALNWLEQGEATPTLFEDANAGACWVAEGALWYRVTHFRLCRLLSVLQRRFPMMSGRPCYWHLPPDSPGFWLRLSWPLTVGAELLLGPPQDSSHLTHVHLTRDWQAQATPCFHGFGSASAEGQIELRGHGGAVLVAIAEDEEIWSAPTTSYVLNPTLQPVPPGASGRLWLAEPGVQCSGDARSTAQYLVPDPFAQRAGARMLRTEVPANPSEPGKWRLAESQLHHGSRPSATMLRAALLELPLRDAYCLRRQTRQGQYCWVAYVVPCAAWDDGDVGVRASNCLPPHLCPDRFVVLPQLPLTQRGEVDCAALLALPVISAEELSQQQAAWAKTAVAPVLIERSATGGPP